MQLNQETTSEETNTSEYLLTNLLTSIFDKFSEVSFTQDKSLFIIQNLIILFSIQKLSFTKKALNGWIKNEWKNSSNENKEAHLKSFLIELTKFVSNYIDYSYSENNLFSLLVLTEENISKVHSCFEFIVSESTKEITNDSYSIIESVIGGYNSYFKIKKEFIYPKVSPTLTKSLLLNSLKPELDNIIILLKNIKFSNSEEDTEFFLQKVIDYRILDPISLTGKLLIDCIPYLYEFYSEIITILEDETFSAELKAKISERIFGKQNLVINDPNFLRILLTRHIFGIVPDENLLFGTKLQLFLAINEYVKAETLVKVNLSFNVIKGNLLLGFPYAEENPILHSVLDKEEVKLQVGSVEEEYDLFKKFVITGENYQELLNHNKIILDAVREEYKRKIQDLKIKSDIYANLSIIHPQTEFFFLNTNKSLKFAFITNIMPLRQKLSISASKIILKQYYNSEEDTIDVINLYSNLFVNFLDTNGTLALVSNRGILYHSEYSQFREKILKETSINFLVDIGDFLYQKNRNSFGILILQNLIPDEQHQIKGLNLVSLDQEQKEQILLAVKEQPLSDDKAIIREIAQSEFLSIQGNRFYIKKPSKWFARFSSMPNVLGEYIESIEESIKLGENKFFFLSESKAKQLQLEQQTLPYGLKGKDFNRYSIPESKVVIRVPSEYTEEGKIAEEFPNTWKYLLENKEYLESRPQVKKGTAKWYEFADHDKVTDKGIRPPKLIIKEKSNEPIAVFDTKGTIQLSSTLAIKFTKQVKFRDYFKVLVWFNSLVVKAGYQDLTQDTKSDAVISKESLKNLYFPISVLKDDMLTSNVQQIVQMCLANKFAFNPHFLLPDYGEGQFHPEIQAFLFDKIYEVLQKKMKRYLEGPNIKLDDVVIISINQENKKKKVDYNYLYPIVQEYSKGILVLQDGDIEITLKIKPRQAYTLSFLQLFLAYQPQKMIVEYLKQYTKPEPLETILGNWPIPQLQMKNVMETYNFVRFQRQNLVNFFNRTRNMLIKVEKLIASHYGFTPEEIEDLLSDRELIEN